jgi:hypothetical protein
MLTIDFEVNPCVTFEIDGIRWLEWTKETLDETTIVERRDSNLRYHYDGDIDLTDLYDFLDGAIKTGIVAI